MWQGKFNQLKDVTVMLYMRRLLTKFEKKCLKKKPYMILRSYLRSLGIQQEFKIIWALDEAEMCVCDIAFLLNMTQSAISHQLRVLKQAELVKSRREGKIVFYSLEDEHVKQIFDQGLIHISEESK